MTDDWSSSAGQLVLEATLAKEHGQQKLICIIERLIKKTPNKWMKVVSDRRGEGGGVEGIERLPALPGVWLQSL